MNKSESDPESSKPEVARLATIKKLIELAREKTANGHHFMLHGSESLGIDLRPPKTDSAIHSTYNLSYSVGSGMTHTSGLREICTVQRNNIKFLETGGSIAEVIRYRVIETPDGEPAIEKHAFLDERKPSRFIPSGIEGVEDEEIEDEVYEMLYGDSDAFVQSLHEAVQSEQTSRETGLAMVYEPELTELIEDVAQSEPFKLPNSA